VNLTVLLGPPFSYEQVFFLSSHLYDTISLSLHLSSLLSNDPTRFKMNLQILSEIEQNFIPRLLTISIDDDLNTQYHFDLLVYECRLHLISEINAYLSCLTRLQSVIEKLQIDDNLYSWDVIGTSSDLSQTQPQSKTQDIKIDQRLIQRIELYEEYLFHGEYLCDIGHHDQGLAQLLNGIQMIERERNGKCLSMSFSCDHSAL
jgi:hypothetical protein